ncbi:MAG: T9SS type A sorting domain-containing protein [Bacteroidales bacterium]|nr:T9SS type A sorting domain-containing protein [Bacteroidales bacterium]
MKYYTNFWALMFATFFSATVSAQSWKWSRNIEVTSTSTGSVVQGIDIDADSNLFASVQINGITDIGSGTNVNLIGSTDFLLVKYDRIGSYLWNLQIGSNVPGGVNPRGVSVNAFGDALVTGFYNQPITSGISIDPPFVNGTDATFLAKVSGSTGTVQWAKRIAWGPNLVRAQSISLGTLEEIYVTGFSTGNIYFENDTLFTTGGRIQNFIAKFQPDGTFVWAIQVLSSSTNQAKNKVIDIACANSNEIYAGGFFTDTVYIDTFKIYATPTLTEDALLIKYNGNGQAQWVRKAGSTGTNMYDRCNGVGVDNSGNVYMTGYFTGTAVFDSTGSGTMDSSPITSAGGFDMMIAKYNRYGKLLWKTSNGDTGGDIGYGAAIHENLVQFAGYFSGTLNFNNNIISSPGTSNQDAAFFVYDVNGNPITAQSVYGANRNDRSEAIVYDNAGSTYIGGSFQSSTLVIGDSSYTNPENGNNGFVAKYALPFSATFSSRTHNTCPGDSLGTLAITTYFGAPPFTYDWSASTGTGVFNDSLAYNLSGGYYEVTITDANSESVTITTSIFTPPAFNIAFDSTNVLCFGDANGTINTTASGGTGTLTYNWSGPGVSVQGDEDQSGLTPGTYYLTLTDSRGCQAFDSVTITEPLPLYFGTVAVTPEDPAGSLTGSISLDVTGGTLPYTFSWDTNGVSVPAWTNDTLVNIPQGIYTAYISDGNLCVSDTVIFVPGEFLRVKLFASNVRCYNDANGFAWAKVVSGDKGHPFAFDFTDNNGDPVAAINDTIYNLIPGKYFVTVTEQGGEGRTAADSIVITQPDSIDLTFAPQNVLCYNNSNGLTGLTVSGGTPAFSYNWSNGATSQSISNLSAGWYKVTVTDVHLCMAVDSVEITQPDSMQVTIFLGHIIACYGDSDGRLLANVTGGTPGYTYQWDDSEGQITQLAVDLTAGAYEVEVTDINGCKASGNYTISQPQPLAFVSVDTNNVSCKGAGNGSISVSLTGGIMPYTYEWNHGLPNVSAVDNLEPLATAYTLTVRDANNCINDTLAFIVKEPVDTLKVEFMNVVHNPCHGNSVGSFEASGNGGWGAYEYSADNLNWLTSGTNNNLNAGTYGIYVRDAGGCVEFGQIEINEPDTLVAGINIISHVNCHNGSDGSLEAIVSGGTMPYSYLWDDSGAQTAQTATGLTAGTYSVEVEDANGCLAFSTTGVTQPQPLAFVTIDTIDVSCKGGSDGRIEVELSGGVLPYSYEWNQGLPDTNVVENLKSGPTAYTLTVRDANNCINDTLAYIVKEPANSLEINLINLSDVLCYNNSNGIVEIEGTGGWGGYEFALEGSPWQPDGLYEDLSASEYTLYLRDNGGCTDTLIVEIGQPAELTANAIVLNQISCYNGSDGSLSVEVSGGTMPYAYLWNDGAAQTNDTAAGLSTGNYTVVVTDANNCTINAAGEITQPDSLMVSIEIERALNCYYTPDAILRAVVTGGTMPYGYQWDDENLQTSQQASGLGKGSYSVEVTDQNGCTNYANIEIESPDSIKIVSVDTANVVCFGDNNGHIGVTMQGGTAPYTFAWSPEMPDTNFVSGLPAGTYTVVTFDALNCPGDTFTYEVKAPSMALGVDEVLTGHTDNLCFEDANGVFEANATGGWGGYEYSVDQIDWQLSPVFADLVAAAYTLTVRDNLGCMAEKVINISHPEQLIINSAVSGKDISVLASGGTPPYTYSLNGEAWQSFGLFTNLSAGTYIVRVMDNNNCGPVESNSLIVLSNISETALSNARLYPNPSNGLINVEFNSKLPQDIIIEIYSLSGARVFNNIYYPDGMVNSVQIDVSTIPQGIYLVKANGILLGSKLIKE